MQDQCVWDGCGQGSICRCPSSTQPPPAATMAMQADARNIPNSPASMCVFPAL